jgi:hypothetical protein
VYGRRIQDRELTFGVSGKLHANSLIMYDHQTDSLWSHLVGAAISGPMQGAKLKPMQSMFTQWGTWKGMHPATKILTTGRSRIFGLRGDPYEDYYRSSDTGIIATRRDDKRIFPKEYVLGLVLDGKAKAYAFSALSKQSVLNDDFEDKPLLIVFDEASATGAVFSRRVDGRTLSFTERRSSRDKNLLLTDKETKSIWKGLSGRATGGFLKGKKLDPVSATPSFWFGWIDHYPETELFYLAKK